MIWKTSIVLIFASFMLNTSAKSISPDSSSSEEIVVHRNVPEALKIFVEYAKKHNLNVSVIASQSKKTPAGEMKQQLAITLHMPPNNLKPTTATLTLPEQTKYLEDIKKLEKEKVAARIRSINVNNNDENKAPKFETTQNEENVISSVNYDILTSFVDGKPGVRIPKYETHEILYNYLIDEGEEKNIQVITGHVDIFPFEASPDTPLDKYEEVLKKSLPLIWMSVDDYTIMAKLLSEKLDKAFPDKSHQVLVGVKDFYSSAKQWAKFLVGDTFLVILAVPKAA